VPIQGRSAPVVHDPPSGVRRLALALAVTRIGASSSASTARWRRAPSFVAVVGAVSLGLWARAGLRAPDHPRLVPFSASQAPLAGDHWPGTLAA